MIEISEDQNTVILDGEVYKAHKKPQYALSCPSCSLYTNDGCGIAPCSENDRKDGKDVIFIEEKK